MSTPGLVTIMMPVLNGELFLPHALESLMAQDYPLFEIVILDNQSTDRTQEISQDFARRDLRIRYIRDTRNRISHDAANHLATFITGEFCMLACDDDLWEPKYLSVLVASLRQHPEVGLVYPNACYVDVEGNRGDQPLLSSRHLYACNDSRLANTWRYLGQRRVVPTIFGLYRSRSYLAALPFITFDETIADVDNLFVVKLMLQTRVQSIDQVLFWYRNKFRGFDPSTGGGWSGSFWPHVRHQWNFLKQILALLDEAGLSGVEHFLLRLRSYSTFIFATTVWRLRTQLGRMLVLLRLREGPTTKYDVHAKIRSASLQAAHSAKRGR